MIKWGFCSAQLGSLWLQDGPIGLIAPMFGCFSEVLMNASGDGALHGP